MPSRLSMFAAALAAGMLNATGAAAAVTIKSINIFHGDSTGNCEDTIAGSGCSPLGVTLAGDVNQPFLNNLQTKQISLGQGSYFLFGNPYGPTNFMTAGNTVALFLTLQDEAAGGVGGAEDRQRYRAGPVAGRRDPVPFRRL